MQHFCNSSPFFFNGIYPFQMPLKKRWTQCRVGSYPQTPPLSYTVALASATPKKSSQNVPIIPTNTAPRLRSFFNFTKKTLISRKKTNFTLSLQNVKIYVHNVTFMIIFCTCLEHRYLLRFDDITQHLGVTRATQLAVTGTA